MQDQERYAYCLDQAEEARTSGRLEQARRWVDQALRANPEGAEAHARRGIVLWDGGRIEEALHAFERSVALEPGLWDAHLDRIEILIEEFHDITEAFELADVMREGPLEAPVEAEVYYLKAKGLYYQDEIEPALFLLRRLDIEEAFARVSQVIGARVGVVPLPFPEAAIDVDHQAVEIEP